MLRGCGAAISHGRRTRRTKHAASNLDSWNRSGRRPERLSRRPRIGPPLSPPGTANALVGAKWATDKDGDMAAEGGKWLEVKYSRPSLRGRTNIFGAGADYGKTVGGRQGALAGRRERDDDLQDRSSPDDRRQAHRARHVRRARRAEGAGLDVHPLLAAEGGEVRRPRQDEALRDSATTTPSSTSCACR